MFSVAGASYVYVKVTNMKNLRSPNSPKSCVLGIDIGTTNVKVIAVDESGNVLDSAQHRHEIRSIKSGWGDQDPIDWWNGLKKSVAELLRRGRVRSDSIVGISVTGQGAAITPVDKMGRSLYPALIWMDRRASDASDHLEHDFSAEIKNVNNNRIDPFNPVPKILWFKNQHPEIFDRTFKFLSCIGYINQKLTGNSTINVSEAGFYLIFHSNTMGWSQTLCESIGIPLEKMPTIYNCTQIIGTLNKKCASDLGLSPRIPVVAGGLDNSCAGLAVGVTEPGQAYYSMGTAGNIGICVEGPLPESRLLSFPHVLSNRWIINGAIATVGACLEWFCREFAGKEKLISELLDMDIFEIMNLEITRSSQPGFDPLVFLPYLSGELTPIWDPIARGILFGLSRKTTRAQVARAIMEGTAYALNHNIRVAEEAGITVKEIRVVGTSGQNEVWNQINADVTNKPVLITSSLHGSPFGAAALAAEGCGLCSNATEFVQSTLKIGKTFVPNKERHERYKKLFHIYCNIYRKLGEEFEDYQKVIQLEEGQ